MWTNREKYNMKNMNIFIGHHNLFGIMGAPIIFPFMYFNQGYRSLKLWNKGALDKLLGL